MAPRYALVDGDPRQHKDAVLALATRNLPGLTRYRFEKRYEHHPLGDPYLVLAQDVESEAFVGMAAAFPTRLMVHGKPVRSAMPGDFAVDAEHRGFGPGFALQRRLHARLKEAELDAAYGAPNRLAEAVLSRLGYADLGRFTDYVRIFKAEVVLERYIRHRGAARAAARLSSVTLDPALRLLPRWRRRARTDRYSVENPHQFDDRFQPLFDAAVVQHAVTGARECELLNWKYEITRPPSSGPRHRIFALVDRQESAAAYIVYRDEDKVRRVYDVLFEDSEEVVDTLLSEFLHHSRAAGTAAISVQYLGRQGLLTSRLRAHGFLPRTGATGVRVKVMDGRPLPSVEDARNWYYLLGENDI